MPEDLTGFPKTYVIIVGGGSGTRMKSSVPKQFLLLNGKPVLMYTIEAFNQSDFHPSIIVVLPSDYYDYWKALCIEHDFKVPHKLAEGGTTRFHSVKKALELIPGDDNELVAIQDAVRPLTSKKNIDASFVLAEKEGNAVTAVKSRDSVRLIIENYTKGIPRDQVFLMQTPQTFKLSHLKNAYALKFNITLTDDASVVEQLGFKINILKGDYSNIKITFPEDIQTAESILKRGYINN